MVDEMKINNNEEELLKKQFERDLENAKQELARAEQNLKEHEFVLEMTERQLDAFKKVKNIIVEGCKPLEPVFEYETNDDYIEYLKIAKELEVEQHIFKLAEQSIPSLKMTIEAKEKAIKSLKEKIAKMEGEE